MCLVRMLMFKWAILKPRLEGIKSEILLCWFEIKTSQNAFSEKKIQTVKLEKNQYGLMVELRKSTT